MFLAKKKNVSIGEKELIKFHCNWVDAKGKLNVIVSEPNT